MRKTRFHLKRFLKQWDKKTLIILLVALLLFILTLGLFLNNNDTIEQTPPQGFKNTDEKGVFEFKRKPKLVDIVVSDAGFSKEAIDVTLDYPDSVAVLRLKNPGTQELEIKVLETPDGNFQNSSARVISPRGERIMHLTKTGVYKIVMENNPNRQLLITISIP